MDPDKLDHECSVFYRYLSGGRPDDYVLGKYQDAHRAGSIDQDHLTGFDRSLLAIAAMGTFFTKMVDVYTTIFFKNAVFRKKLILLIAILESYAPVCYKIDSVTVSNKMSIFSKLFFMTLIFALSLLLSIALLMPLHVFYKIISGTGSS